MSVKGPVFMKQILVVEDDARMRKIISDFLQAAKYKVIEADNGAEALRLFSDNPQLTLVILDVMLPEYDGWSVCKRIRATSSIPIIFLTAREDEMDELFGFELGADEYIRKPFSPNILVARVKALLKRNEQQQHNYQPLTKNIGGIHVDENARSISVDGKLMPLSPKEYALLVYLIDNEGSALSRSQILSAVWNYDYHGYYRTIDTHIKRLRLKLSGKKNYIKTIRNYGYSFQV
jgi:DNA-binding response OmpR family regulator